MEGVCVSEQLAFAKVLRLCSLNLKVGYRMKGKNESNVRLEV